MRIPTAVDFQAELDRIFHAAQEIGQAFIDVKSGDLHRRVGGYPSSNHRMPTCCEVMERNMKAGDIILQAPPSHRGATLEIRYRIPR